MELSVSVGSKFVVPGVVFLLTLASGVWLGLNGKPFNGVLFNLHKLIALGGVILAGMQIVRALRAVDAGTLLIALVIVAGLCILALFASGALISAGVWKYTLLRGVHTTASILVTLALAGVAYLLAR
jgi:hypothetical protein